MSIKKNFLYSSILTASYYIFPFFTFPYVSRVLGVNNIGICNFVDGVINYYILFSMMGIGTIGIREIAKNQNSPKELNKSFSSLFLLNAITTLIVLLIFLISILFVPQFCQHKEMFYIGGGKILFNLFLIDWFYKGIENFRYITIRSIIVQTIYVFLVFIFVNQKEDYTVYYFITVGTLIINALFNWWYRRKFVKLNFSGISIKLYLRSFLILGFYFMLTSMYTSFNVVYLGFVAGEKEVGFYTTATKLYGILLALFTAFTGVMLPRMSSLVAEGKIDEVKLITQKSFDALFMFCFPLIAFSEVLSPKIIAIIAGPGYEGAILPMRLVMPLMLVIGIEQILIIQILMPLKNDNAVLINSIIGAAVGTVLNILIVKYLKSTGSSIVWVVSELAVLISANYFVKRKIGIYIPYKKIMLNIIYSIPYAVFCFLISSFYKSDFVILANSFLISLIYFVFIQFKVLKNEILLSFYNKVFK